MSTPLPALQVRPAVTLAFPALAVVVGAAVYRDARARGHGEVAPWTGFVVGGLFLAGSLPGLVALAVADEAAVQGFPTSLRLLPGVAALLLYLRFR